LTQAEDEPVDEPQAAKWTKVDTSVLDAAALADADNEDSNEGDDGDEMPVDQAPFVLLADPLAAAPASLAPPDPPEPLPTFGYYICASDEVVIAASNVISLPRSDPLNSFFQDLHDGFLAFETIPDATGVKLLNKADFADEVGDWFVRGFGADVVTAKRLGIDFLSALSIGFSKPLPMMFSTEAIKLSFDWDASKPLPPCGYITSQKSMIFGLDPKTLPTPTTQLSLGGILEFLDLPGDHLLALNVTAGLILDTSTVPANRNAIWFSPWNNYETVLRLQFKLADEGALTSFITNNISSKIQIVTPRVIVRKRMSWFHNSDGFECIPDPQIIFSVSIKRDNGSHIDTILTFDMGIVTLTMRPNGTLVDFLDWMADLAGADKAEVGTINQWVGKVSSHLPTVLELRIQANSFGLQAFYVVMELEVELGKADGQSENVVFLVSESQPGFLSDVYECLDHLSLERSSTTS
jgi:hypothetical protein